MDLEKLSDVELRKLLSKYDDLRIIPVSVSTRSFVIKKLKDRERSSQDGAITVLERMETNQSNQIKASPASIKEVKSIKPIRKEKIVISSPVPAPVNKDERANDYPAPKTSELNAFRVLIEGNDAEGFKREVCNNPRLLVTSSDTPEILKQGFRYNALHCAVIKGHLEICKLLFDNLKSDLFWSNLYPKDPNSIGQRRNHLIDLYLNLCEDRSHETPLHLACKYGHEDVVEYLLGFSSMLNVSVKNKFGESPSQVARDSTRFSSLAKKESIIDLLSEPHVYYVRVLRAPDNSLCPKLDKPSLYDELRTKVGKEGSALGGSPYADPRVVSSFAGPMSPQQAKRLYSEWHSPSHLADQHVKRADPDRGLERVGRHLAHQQGLPWSEFWEFLNCSCDLSKEAGRRALEAYLQGAWSSREAHPQSRIDLRASPELNFRNDVEEEKGGDSEGAGQEAGMGGAEEGRASAVDEELSVMMEQKLSVQDSFEFSTPQIRRVQPVASSCFLTGSEPTKLDYDVMLALDATQYPISQTSFPYISKWLNLVHTYSEGEQKLWRTPIRVEDTGGVALWRSPQKPNRSSTPRPFFSLSQNMGSTTSSLLFSTSPSSQLVKKPPRRLFHPLSSTLPLDMDKP